MSKVHSEKKECIFLGDLNIDLMKLDVQSICNELLELFYSYGFFPIITKPTRITNFSATLIDNIFTNSVCNIYPGILTSDISDHLPIFALFDFKGIYEEEPVTYKHQINEMNINCFLDVLSTTDFDHLLRRYHQEPNLMYKQFMEFFSETYNKCFPLRRTKFKKNHKPWFTKKLKQMCSKKKQPL